MGMGTEGSYWKMSNQNQIHSELLCELDEVERHLVQIYRSGHAEEIISALKECGSLPAHWPEHPDKH